MQSKLRCTPIHCVLLPRASDQVTAMMYSSTTALLLACYRLNVKGKSGSLWLICLNIKRHHRRRLRVIELDLQEMVAMAAWCGIAARGGGCHYGNDSPPCRKFIPYLNSFY